MRNRGIRLTLTLIILALAGSAHAFDGDRQGFVLNLGAGVGQGQLKVSSDGSSISSEEAGFSTVFKIGGGLSEQSVLYYTNRVVFWSSEGFDINTGMSAVGYSYFLEPQAPSFFFSGSLGIGVATVEDEGETGPGLGLGVGYEFTKNWTAELHFLTTQLDEVGDVTLTASNVALTVSWFAY